MERVQGVKKTSWYLWNGPGWTSTNVSPLHARLMPLTAHVHRGIYLYIVFNFTDGMNSYKVQKKKKNVLYLYIVTLCPQNNSLSFFLYHNFHLTYSRALYFKNRVRFLSHQFTTAYMNRETKIQNLDSSLITQRSINDRLSDWRAQKRGTICIHVYKTTATDAVMSIPLCDRGRGGDPLYFYWK